MAFYLLASWVRRKLTDVRTAQGRKTSKVQFRGDVPAIGWSVAPMLGLVCSLTWLATKGATLLPTIVLDNSRLSPFVIYPVSLTILISAAALTLLLFRQRSVLDRWLVVVALCTLRSWHSVACFRVSALVPAFTPGACFRSLRRASF